jgi:endo-1,4-beta-xylanase
MRQLADHAGVRWGVMMPAAHVGTVLEKDPLYRARCLDNFNLLAIPDFGWSRVEPEQDAWALGPVSAAADFAAAAGMTAMGMHLLWGHPSQIPAWLRPSAESHAVRDHALTHVGAVVHAMRGRVAVWSVLNELDGAPWVVGSDFWRKALTPGDIVDVFHRVREQDAKAKLLVNDFGIEVPGGPGFIESRRDRVLRLVMDLRSQNAPLDGIGFQMHLDASHFRDPTVRSRRLSLFGDNIRSFQDAGVEVCVTELDVKVDGVRGSVADRLSIQSDLYESVLQTALEAGVLSVTFWGLSDKYAIDMQTGQVPPAPGRLLLDEAMQPKPSYYAAERVLRRRAHP